LPGPGGTKRVLAPTPSATPVPEDGEAGEGGTASPDPEAEQLEAPPPPQTAEKPMSEAEIALKVKWEERLAVASHEGLQECFIKLDLVVDSAPFLELIGEDPEDPADGPPRWRCRDGLIKNVPKVAGEFLQRRGLGAMRILLSGADIIQPSKGMDALATRLAARYKVPHINLQYVLKEVANAEGPHYNADLAAMLKQARSIELIDPSATTEDAEAAAPVEGEPEAEGEEGTEGTPDPSAPVMRPETPLNTTIEGPSRCGWTPSKAVYVPSKARKQETLLTKIQTQPDLLEAAYRHVLSVQTCRNLGFVLSSGIGARDAELLFRDAPPPPPPLEDGEEPPPEPEEGTESAQKSAPDNRICGQHMPEVCVVVEGPEAKAQEGVPSVVQFVLDSEIAKSRNQHAIRVNEKDLLDPMLSLRVMESTIQKIGRPRHYGFGTNEAEGLKRLEPTKEQLRAASPVAGEAAETEEVEKEGLSDKEREAIMKQQEKLSAVVSQETAEQQASADEAARAYALKFALPALHRAMCMAGRIRPDDPVDFVANFLMHYEELKDSLPEPGKLNLPEH